MKRVRRGAFLTLGSVLTALLVALPFLATGCSQDTGWPDKKGPKVAVSFAPIACFAMNVAGDDAVVRNMMTSSGPHHFNPTDADARLLRHANLFLVNGLGLDDEVANRLAKASGNRKLTPVRLADRIPKTALIDWKHEGVHHDHDGHDHGHYDPHVWLSPDLAVVMVEGIRDELKQADPDHAADYDQRAAAYIDKLHKLKEEGRGQLGGKADRRFVTFHESLNYFARDFGLTVAGVVMPKAGTEPGPDDLNKLIAMCVQEKVRVIAVEPQYGTGTSARVLIERLRERGVPDPKTVEIDPLETVAADDLTPDWYERKMRDNIAALAGALK